MTLNFIKINSAHHFCAFTSVFFKCQKMFIVLLQRTNAGEIDPKERKFGKKEER